MKRTFHIPANNEIEVTNAVLLCELSQYHACIGIADAYSKAMLQLSFYELKNGLAPATLSDLLIAEKIEPASIKRTFVSNAFKEMVMVPLHHFSEESAKRFYATTFGTSAEILYFDDVSEQNLIVVHAMPRAHMDILKSAYGTEIKHHYTCQLKTYNGFIAENQIAVHFTNKEIYIVAKGEQQLKLAQTYIYSTPLDVVYYLLSICQQFHLSQSETTLILSGLISEDSAMYKELHQYFAALQFWKPVSKGTLPSEYPNHFFSSMYTMAACVL